MDKLKSTIIIIGTALMGWIGILAVPLFLLLAFGVFDYITGCWAAESRGERISSEKSRAGIKRKVGNFILILVVSGVDILINYSFTCAGSDFREPFIFATVVAVWLTVNESISILENLGDVGTPIPKFLKPLMQRIQKTAEDAGEKLVDTCTKKIAEETDDE